MPASLLPTAKIIGVISKLSTADLQIAPSAFPENQRAALSRVRPMRTGQRIRTPDPNRLEKCIFETNYAPAGPEHSDESDRNGPELLAS
jgi:hypothetical protein